MSSGEIFNPPADLGAPPARRQNPSRHGDRYFELRSVTAYEAGEFAPESDRLRRIAAGAQVFRSAFFFGDDLGEPALDARKLPFHVQDDCRPARHGPGSGAIALLLNQWIEARFTLPEPNCRTLGRTPIRRARPKP